MPKDNSLAEMHWKHDLLGSIEVGIVVLDEDYNVQVWNQFMENHSGIVPSQIKDKCLFDFFVEIDQNWLKIKADPVFTLRTPVFVIWEQRPYLCKFTSSRPITSQSDFMYQNITIFPLASLTGKVEQICIVIYDVTDEAINSTRIKSLNNELQQLSRVDGLTDLYNRRYWEAQLATEFKRNKRSNLQSSLIMLDIDHFKKVNDTYGHSAGDEVIRAVATVIKKASRDTDVCGRYGGEEFAILLPDTPEENVKFLADRIRRLIEKLTVVYAAQSISFTVSIGIAGFRQSFDEHVKWLDCADKALYQAKVSGRNLVVVAE
ncbi:MAG: diguanylate cyclase [Paraglaciecola sp.]|jgi:diguanylate cyclase